MTWLISWLWQGAAIAIVTGVVLRAASRLNAATRYTVWSVSLVAVAALPATWSLARLFAGPPAPADPSRAVSAASPAALPVELPAVPDWLIAARLGRAEDLWPQRVAGGGTGAAAGRGTWAPVADAGLAVGAGIKAACVSTAGFFRRAGVSIAGAF